MASTAVALQFRSKHRPIGNQTFVHLFSSSTSDSNSESTTPSSSTTPDKPSPLPQSPAQSQSTFSSYFSDVKASLKQQQPPKPFNFTPSTPPRPQNPPAKVASLEEIRKNLAEFRRRSNIPPPDKQNSSAPNSSQQVSFHELYQRNVVSRGEESMGNANKGGRLSFEAIRESLRQMKPRPVNNQAEPGGRSNQPMSFTRFQESLKMRPADPNAKEPPLVIGGSDKLPLSIFGKEIKEKKDPQSAPMKTEFVRTYSYAELGEKLRLLRPQTKDGEKIPFSLSELNERLMKLREMEEKESESRIGGVTFKDLRESLIKLQTSDDAKARNTSIQRLNVLGHLGATPSFMLQPPKEHLVEKYFHPDNMSSAEKLKLELQKVRDEFKMSESDCGSARVQVAQLTTKIKHLSTVLHKKDKHSRKGLLAMVQQRKKLLKYLRRTDWDSYCLVLSKLGLRDNPDFKN